MTLPAFAFIFLLGSVFGALIMFCVVVQATVLNERQRTARFYWSRQYLVANAKAIERQARLDAIHAQHVEAGRKGGKTVHERHRERVLAKAAEMRAEIAGQKSTVVHIRDAA